LNKPGTLVVLFGPTGVGKTELLGRLAGWIPRLEVISADSMQVYRGLDIGTAKPPAELLARVPHHLIDIVEPDEQFSAGHFVRRAEALVAEIRARGAMPVLCGGTAYYLRSFLCGLPEAPASDPALRRRLKARLLAEGLGALQEELGRVDPGTAAAVARRDSHRVLRALEVFYATGRPLSAFRSPDRVRQDFTFLLLGLHREREELYRRIDRRVELMFELGLADEVRGLLARGFGPQDPGLRGIGYREFCEMRRGCWNLREVRAAIQLHSRQYAKRQITFFKSLPGVEWRPAGEPEEVLGRVREFLSLAEQAGRPAP